MPLQRRSRTSAADRSRERGPFAAVLVARRQELGLTQTELADLAGVARGPVVALEAGRAGSLEVLVSILRVLGLHLELVRGTTTEDVVVGADLGAQYHVRGSDPAGGGR